MDKKTSDGELQSSSFPKRMSSPEEANVWSVTHDYEELWPLEVTGNTGKTCVSRLMDTHVAAWLRSRLHVLDSTEELTHMSTAGQCLSSKAWTWAVACSSTVGFSKTYIQLPLQTSIITSMSPGSTLNLGTSSIYESNVWGAGGQWWRGEDNNDTPWLPKHGLRSNCINILMTGDGGGHGHTMYFNVCYSWT